MPDKSDDSLIERMKKLPLWQWGGITIFAGIIANMAVTLMIQAQGMRAPKSGARGLAPRLRADFLSFWASS